MKMKKGLLTMLALLSMGSSAFAQGTLDVPEVARATGNVKQVVVLESEKKGTVKIRLAGTENYRDLQFDIKLPAGVEAADGNVVINTDHAVESAVQASDAQTVRFVLYSETGANLSNDILLEIPVTVTGDVASVNNAKATLSNVLSSDANATTSIEVAGTEFPFSVMKLGDVTDDGTVNSTDATAILYDTFNSRPATYVEEVADVNRDTRITATDAVGALYIYWNVSGSAKGIVLEEEEDNELDPE
ncbi:MAG: hypothetical protein IKX44_03030 [Prevotella sp.]|nr:hypothetical protein [Prevotella sp.]